jgi:hypothetical protein
MEPSAGDGESLVIVGDAMPRKVSTATSVVSLGGEKAPGYAVNGLSLYSRESAHRVPTPKMASRPDRVRGPRHTLLELIAETEARIAHVRADLRVEDSEARRVRLSASLEIKLKFLDKLRHEARHG